MKKFLFFLFPLFLTGCMALQADPALLRGTESNTTPLLPNDYTVTATLTPELASQMSAENLDNLVQQSTDYAIREANIFANKGNGTYIIHAHVTQASQAMFGAGRFNGKLEINYQVKDPNNSIVFEKSYYTEAGSDRWYFAAQKRHTRSRIVNVSKNVNQFVKDFNQYLKEKTTTKKSTKTKSKTKKKSK
ncbi:hypothetical protein [Lonepinella sp. MS14435]|uniref:hypothetical protein n=1 Tax=Lonepinella sp. MS14435 TaxID=3003618 RepID=UPI0036DE6273